MINIDFRHYKRLQTFPLENQLLEKSSVSCLRSEVPTEGNDLKYLKGYMPDFQMGIIFPYQQYMSR